MSSNNPENSPHPEDCKQNCGVINGLTGHIDSDNAVLDELLWLSLSKRLDGSNPIIVMAMRHLNIVPISQTTEFPPRQTDESSLDVYAALVDHTQGLERMRDATIRDCRGPVGLRAIIDGTEISLLVCRSDLAPEGAIIEPTVVSRRKIEL